MSIASSPASSPCSSPAINNIGSGSVPWSPLNIASLQAWFDMSDTDTIETVNAAGRVSKLTDKSDAAIEMISTDTSKQANTGVTTINGLNTVSGLPSGETVLDVVGNQTGNSPTLDPDDFEINIVAMETAGTDCECWIAVRALNGGDIIVGDWRAAGGGGICPGPVSGAAGQGAFDFFGGGFVKGEANLMTFRGNTTGYELWRNGVLERSYTYAAGERMTDFDRFMFFSRAAGSNESDVAIGECIVSGYLSTADKQAVEGYLADKWGI